MSRLFDRLRHAATRLGRRLESIGPPGRNLETQHDDLFLVSYPKSGNTWARFLLGNLLSPGEEVTFANLERTIPDIYQNPPSSFRGLPRPRVIKSHEYLQPRYSKVIYIVRDPRDVAVSYYHYLIKVRLLEDGSPWAEYIDRFIEGRWDPFGSWRDHVGGWLGARQGTPGFLLLRYEAMLEHPGRELMRMAEHLGIEAGKAAVGHAVDASSFERMRGLEREQGAQWTPMKGSREDLPFVRSARCGGWRDELPEASVQAIEAAWSDLMIELDYSPETI